MVFYYLEIVRGIESGTRVVLTDGALSIGRHPDNTVCMHAGEKSVSGHHTLVYKTLDRIFIQDLQSTNGTFVNEERVTEKDLRPNDEIGFGQNGPRMKMIVSSCELPLIAEPDIPDSTDDTSMETTPRIAHDSGYEYPAAAGSSSTLEVEGRLLRKRLEADDMHALLKDGRRMDKIISRGNLGKTSEHVLTNAFIANRRMRRRLYIIIVLIAVAGGGLALFFAGRAVRYKHLLDKGARLEQQLDQYDSLIARVNADPEENREELLALINRFEETKRKFSAVAGNLRAGDYRKFFSDSIEARIDDIMGRFGEADYHIPPEMVSQVKKHLDSYTGPLHDNIQTYLYRKNTYYDMILEVLRRHNLPQELVYVAMQESGYNPTALSHAGARGLWQFMPRTARGYGLKVGRSVDERTDPRKSTEAAAEYFKDLIAIFGGGGSVLLAMAAYNAGESRVINALRKIDDPVRNRDFWYIYRLGILALETNEYIPRIITMIIIAENPRDYGFTEQPPPPGN